MVRAFDVDMNILPKAPEAISSEILSSLSRARFLAGSKCDIFQEEQLIVSKTWTARYVIDR